VRSFEPPPDRHADVVPAMLKKAAGTHENRLQFLKQESIL
jgi:hypothetical protein